MEGPSFKLRYRLRIRRTPAAMMRMATAVWGTISVRKQKSCHVSSETESAGSR